MLAALLVQETNGARIINQRITAAEQELALIVRIAALTIIALVSVIIATQHQELIIGVVNASWLA